MLMRPPNAAAVAASLPDIEAPDLRRSSLRRRSSPLPRLKPTPRYFAVLDLIFRCRALTDHQIHFALFPPANFSGCKRTLTLLYKHKWIDRLPRRFVNEPYIYTLTKKSIVGNRILKDKHGEQMFSSEIYKFGYLEHLLAINEIRVRAEKAAEIDVWRRPEQLAKLFGPRLQPDAYFRVTGDGVAGFFLELQRSVKSHKILISKLNRYQELFSSAGFHSRRMFVLIVFTSEYERTAAQRVAHALRQTPADRYPFVRFASLDSIKAASDIYTEQIWFHPSSQQPLSLF